MRTGRVDREGAYQIDFSDPTKVPDFVMGTDKVDGRRRLYLINYREHPTTRARTLVGLGELDVTRDLVDFAVVTTSDQEAKPIEYYLEMNEWDPKGLGLHIVYKEPLQIGKGGDSIMSSIKNPAMFVSEETGLSLPADKATSAKIAPTQMATGVSEATLQT